MIMAGETLNTGRKNCPNGSLSDTNPTRTDMKWNPGFRGEGLATDRLRHGTTSKMKMTPKMQL